MHNNETTKIKKAMTFLNLHNNYGFKFTPEPYTGNIPIKEGTPCFSTIYNKSKVAFKDFLSVKIHIRNKQGDTKNNDLCLPYSYMKKYVDYIAKAFQIKIKISRIPDGYILSYSEKMSKPAHIYVYTILRFLYEAPFNICLREAYILAELPEFKNYNILQLFYMVFALSKDDYNGAHAIWGRTGSPDHFDLEALIGILQESERDTVNASINYGTLTLEGCTSYLIEDYQTDLKINKERIANYVKYAKQLKPSINHE